MSSPPDDGIPVLTDIVDSQVPVLPAAAARRVPSPRAESSARERDQASDRSNLNIGVELTEGQHCDLGQ